MPSNRTRILIAIMGMLYFCSCVLPPPPRPGAPFPVPAPVAAAPVVAQTLYTAHNMWCEKENLLACINYKRGMLIPAGTQVSASIARGALRVARSQNVITFTVLSSPSPNLNGQTFTVTFSEKYHPGSSLQAYFAMMFTASDFNALTAGMTPEEINAISQGVLVAGMSKRAVIVSYGPPPEHKTPTRGMNVWTYWTSRYGTKQVFFDGAGRTITPSAARQAVAPNQI